MHRSLWLNEFAKVNTFSKTILHFSLRLPAEALAQAGLCASAVQAFAFIIFNVKYPSTPIITPIVAQSQSLLSKKGEDFTAG